MEFIWNKAGGCKNNASPIAQIYVTLQSWSLVGSIKEYFTRMNLVGRKLGGKKIRLSSSKLLPVVKSSFSRIAKSFVQSLMFAVDAAEAKIVDTRMSSVATHVIAIILTVVKNAITLVLQRTVLYLTHVLSNSGDCYNDYHSSK